MPGPAVVPIALGIGNILGSVFGNLFGASKQAGAAKDATLAQTRAAEKAAQLEYQALTEALNYQKEIDARDYGDWLVREGRDRRDWEASEKRKAPFRALADSAVRTLADYIRVPGMHAPQEIPVQEWSHQGPKAPTQPTSHTMPVGGGRTLYDLTGGSNSGFVTPSRGRTLRDFTY